MPSIIPCLSCLNIYRLPRPAVASSTIQEYRIMPFTSSSAPPNISPPLHRMKNSTCKFTWTPGFSPDDRKSVRKPKIFLPMAAAYPISAATPESMSMPEPSRTATKKSARAMASFPGTDAKYAGAPITMASALVMSDSSLPMSSDSLNGHENGFLRHASHPVQCCTLYSDKLIVSTSIVGRSLPFAVSVLGKGSTFNALILEAKIPAKVAVMPFFRGEPFTTRIFLFTWYYSPYRIKTMTRAGSR